MTDIKVKCSECGAVYNSGIDIDGNIGVLTISDVNLECPNGHKNYFKTLAMGKINESKR